MEINRQFRYNELEIRRQLRVKYNTNTLITSIDHNYMENFCVRQHQSTDN